MVSSVTKIAEGAALKALMTGINQAQFAKKHNFPGGASMISQNISGNRPITLEGARIYSLGLGVSINSFSKRLSTEISRLQYVHANVAPAYIGSRRVPLISGIQAGKWTEIVDSFQLGDAEEWLLTTQDVSTSAFALRIKGKSMYRPDSAESYDEGDIVIIDPAVNPQPGDCVAARNSKGEATFKKYRPRGLNDKGVEYFELVPLNADFPTLRSDLEPANIIGTMMEHRKYRRKS